MDAETWRESRFDTSKAYEAAAPVSRSSVLFEYTKYK